MKYDIYIKENECTKYIKLNNDKTLSGIKILNNRRYPLIKEDLDILNCFKLSNNNKVIKTTNNYKKILDLDTYLYHYIDNKNNEIINMFIYKNCINAALYSLLENNKINSNIKQLQLYKNGKKIIISFILSAILLNALYTSKNIIDNYNPNIHLVSYTVSNDYSLTCEKIKEAIYSSNSLSDEYKDFLYNEDYLNFIIPYLNENPSACYELLNFRLKNIQIVDAGNPPEDNLELQASYSPLEPNIIKVYNLKYKRKEELKIILAHEFVHMTQFFSDYSKNLIVESETQIIVNEFYCKNHCPSIIDHHQQYEYIVKMFSKLNEIINSKLICKFLYCDNYTPLENELKKYLTSEELELFNNSMQFEVTTNEETSKENDEKYNIIQNLIDTIYLRKYNENINQNNIINSINNGTILRYYFNENKMTQEYSYILISPYTYTTRNLNVEEKMKNGLSEYYIADNNQLISNYKTYCTYKEKGIKIIEKVNQEKTIEWNKKLGFNYYTKEEAINLLNDNTINFKDNKGNYYIKEIDKENYISGYEIYYIEPLNHDIESISYHKSI